MDIEQLSKSQIVLLTLLVSFVTSIATGIVTVSLMDQAPPTVAQTVNRVIEHTIQTVAATSSASNQPAAAAVVTQEKTIVVNESDLMAQAVAKISPSIVRIYASDAQDATLLGLGLVLDDQGYIFTDSSALGDNADATLVLPDGTRARAFVTKRDDATGFAYLQATTTPAQPLPTWTPISIATDHPLLGEAVIAISGKTVARIAPGVITSIAPADKNGIIAVDTNIASGDIIAGSPIVNTDGSVVGVSTGVSRTSSDTGFISSSILTAAPQAAK